MEKGKLSFRTVRWFAFLPAGAACGAFGFWAFKIAGDALETVDAHYAGGIRLLGVVAMGLINVIVAKVVAPSRSHWIPSLTILSCTLIIAMWILLPKNDAPLPKLLMLCLIIALMIVGCILGVLAGWLFEPTRKH
jgi:hypothetical protein